MGGFLESGFFLGLMFSYYERVKIDERITESVPLYFIVNCVFDVASNTTSPLSTGVTELQGANQIAPFTSSL
jgi:hypothetical protein